MLAPRVFERPRIANPRSIRGATARRIVRTSRARQATLFRAFSLVVCVLVPVMGYVVLTSRLTGLSYAVDRAQATREALQEQTLRLDDRIAAQTSDERLAAIASKLGMREPTRFVAIRLETPRVAQARPHFSIRSFIAGL